MHEIDKAKFGTFVSRLRRERGITQKDLASRLYISDKAVSKWETGVSVPDVALLVPLSEALGITVTELLKCERIPAPEPMESQQVEELLKAAISCSGEVQRPNRKKQLPRFLGFALLAMFELLTVAFFCQDSPLLSTLFALEIMMICFAGYFILFLQEKLPDYYDQNEIRYFNDGFLKLNLPGVTFHNRNWPHIRHAAIRSSQVCGLVFPLVFLLCEMFIPPNQIALRVLALLIPTLGGLIGPMWHAALKHP